MLIPIRNQNSIRMLLYPDWRSEIVWMMPELVVVALHRRATHSTNGPSLAALAGLVLCVAIHRTQSLWFAIGFHAAWDFGESYVYAVPDSGWMARGHLLKTHLHGPWWISGGSVGPEGSLICMAVLLTVAILLWKRPNPVLDMAIENSHNGD